MFLTKFQAQKFLLVKSINNNLTQTLLESTKSFYEANITLIQNMTKITKSKKKRKLQTSISYDYNHKNQPKYFSKLNPANLEKGQCIITK